MSINFTPTEARMNLASPRPGILSIDPYTPGSSKTGARPALAKLSSNECSWGPSPKAIEAYRTIGSSLFRYPDPGAQALREAIAERHGIDANRIVCGNGSDELITLMARAYAGPGDEIVHSQFGFLMFRLAAQAVGATPVSAPEEDLTAQVDALLACVSARTRLVYIANPNNPTGTLLPTSEIARLRSSLPEQVILVLDSAYGEFVEDDVHQNSIRFASEAPNVVVLRTFSKVYGLASLRIGWAYAPADVVDVLHRIRSPFNANSAAQAAAAAALADKDWTSRIVRETSRWRSWLFNQCTEAGLDATPGFGNFVLARIRPDSNGSAKGLDDFLQARGVIVRSMMPYRLPNALRISVGTQEENELFGTALREAVASATI